MAPYILLILQQQSTWVSESKGSNHRLQSPVIAITNLPFLRITACNPCHQIETSPTGIVCCVVQEELSSPKIGKSVKKFGVAQKLSSPTI